MLTYILILTFLLVLLIGRIIYRYHSDLVRQTIFEALPRNGTVSIYTIRADFRRRTFNIQYPCLWIVLHALAWSGHIKHIGDQWAHSDYSPSVHALP